MDERRERYVEDFGLLFERVGGSRMLGRVLGVLLISDPPERSAEELANLLHASRGSISQATRTLVGMGMVRRLTRRGERRDYFRVKPDAWYETSLRQTSEIAVFQEMAEHGLGSWIPRTPKPARPRRDARHLRVLEDGVARRAGAVERGKKRRHREAG